MKILILTQIVDIDDPALGFFHSWIIEFAKHCERVTVICLKEGKHSLPSNVKVFSLGKEKGNNRFEYVLNFYKYIWQERKNYQTVFVHMNQEYILLAGWWWRLTGKKILMWRNHAKGNFLTSVAVAVSQRVFCTSEDSYTAKFKKTKVLAAGINIDKFNLTNPPIRNPRSLLVIGRISSVKKIEVFVKALILLEAKGIIFKALIVGDRDPAEPDYYDQIVVLSRDLVDKGHLSFIPAVPNTETPLMYHSHEIVVNMTGAGSFDKTILSAMTSGALVVVSNPAYKDVLPAQCLFKENDATDLASKLAAVLDLTTDVKKQIVSTNKLYVIEEHGLPKTIREILNN